MKYVYTFLVVHYCILIIGPENRLVLITAGGLNELMTNLYTGERAVESFSLKYC